MQRVLIYRNELLPLSETFIHNQTAALRSYLPIYIGLRPRRAGLELNADAVLLSKATSSAARLRGFLYKSSGIAPLFHTRARQVDAKLLHAHFAVDGSDALSLASATDLPLMVTLWGSDVTTTDDSYSHSATGRIYLARRKRLWARASVFLCISDFIKRKAIEAGFPAAKLQTHYTGIDLNYFNEPKFEQPRDSVVFVARLVEKKGCAYLIRAMQQVQAAMPAARLVIIGDGAQRAELEALAKSLHVQCQFKGAQSSEAVRRELATARVFCVPSVTASTGDSEGLGIVFAEAQAMGVPVVSSWHGGIPEIVSHGETGLLAPEKDSSALAAHILRFFQDDTFWMDCRVKGRRRIADKFEIRKQTDLLEEVYSDVAHQSAKS